jgi:uncharacterized protein (DUF924 family)
MDHQDGPEYEPPPSPSLQPADESSEIELAREWVGNAARRDEPHESEMAANTMAWAHLLDQWTRGVYPGTAEEFEEECRDHVDRSIALGEAYDRECDERFAIFRARIEARYLADRERG